MKLLLAAINAKYIHTNLAVRSLCRYAEARGLEAGFAEFTVNQQPDEILRELFRQSPDLIGFSCYLWNYSLVRRLCAELRLLLPDCLLVLGGPEVSYTPAETLAEVDCDGVLAGEGEASFALLAAALQHGEDWRATPGLTCRADGAIRANPPPPLSLDELPFPYLDGDEALDPAAGRILYYECSRGCPFRCQYCLSGGEGGVRRRSPALVTADFARFLALRVPQVKLVDRTFNADKDYALSLWKWLAAHDNGVTNFHFELAAELLGEEELAFLATVRPGLFQFEIGVQSTNPETLRAIRRITLPERLTPIVRRLQAGRNIHLHLDLIAGLPFEGFARFGESFDYVHSLAPDQLQLGILKLLKGSGLARDAAEYGLAVSPFPPYPVRSTPRLTYGELLRLEQIAALVDHYYNSHRYEKELAALLGCFATPFCFWESFASWYEARGLHRAPHAKREYYTFLREFALIQGLDAARWECKARWDLYSHEKAKRLPDWMSEGLKNEYREDIFTFFDNKDHLLAWFSEYEGLDTRQILRSAHLEIFPFDPDTGAPGRFPWLFNYRRSHFPSGAFAMPLAISAVSLQTSL